MVSLSATYTPTEPQRFVHSQPHRTKVLICARRWGKSRFALFEMLKRYVEALSIPVQSSEIPPWHCWVVVPTLQLARQTWEELKAFIPEELKSDVDNTNLIIILRGSSLCPWGKIEIKSGYDPLSLQTSGLDFLWSQESQDISQAAYERMVPTLRSPRRQRYAVFEGIPPLYPDHWFWRLFQSADRGLPDHFAYRGTYLDNVGNLDPDIIQEIENDREKFPDAVWRRMYLAEMSDMAGFFRRIDESLGGDLLEGPLPGRRYVAGLDLGRLVDATVMWVWDAEARRAVAFHTWDAGESWPEQRQGTAHIVRSWGIERLMVDGTGMGGDIFVQELQEAGVPAEPYVFHQQSRKELLERLQLGFERHSIQIPPELTTLRQLRAFQHRKLPSGYIRGEAPPGEHDDAVMALALGLWVCEDGVGVTASRHTGTYSRNYYVTDEANGGRGRRMMEERRVERMHQRVAMAEALAEARDGHS